MRRLLYLAAGLLLLAACSGKGREKVLFSGFESLPAAEWVYFKPVEFTVDSATAAADSVLSGALVMSVRHTASYPFRNIWVEVSQGGRRDTFEVMLADAFGRWYGSGMGSSLRLNDTLCPDYTVHAGSAIAVRHIMRTDTLPGIEQIGLIVKSND